MSATLLAQMAQEAAPSITGFLVAKQKHKLDKENQRHRNAVTGISANLQRNATTLQEVDVRNANRRQDQALQVASLQAASQAEVSAAAAGVSGGSVQSVMRGLKRSSMNAQYARIENTQNAYQELGQQRTNINVSQIFQTDTTVLPKPSLGALLLSVGQSSYDVYEEDKRRREQI